MELWQLFSKIGIMREELLFLGINFRDMTFETPKSFVKSQLSNLSPSYHMKLFLIRHCKRPTWATAGATLRVVCQRAPSRGFFMVRYCFIIQAVRQGLHLRKQRIRSINISSDCLPKGSWHMVLHIRPLRKLFIGMRSGCPILGIVLV